MTLSATSTIGEPIGRSATMTVHDAVPPRISGPYDGIHDTVAALDDRRLGEDLAGEQEALAAEPAEDRGVLHGSGLRRRHGLRSSSRSTSTPSG